MQKDRVKLENQEQRVLVEFSSAMLHILAMVIMLGDHIWATILPGQEWLTWVGRIAFPIFAFMIVEGYFHTHDFRKYCLRLLGFAILSEIPFDLIYGGTFFLPSHQNVIWTFLIGLLLIRWMEWAKGKDKIWLTILVATVSVLLGFLLGMLTMVDYYGPGVLTVLVFYFFHGRKWWCLVGQLICLYWLNVEVLGGYYQTIKIFGFELEIVQQGLALLALIPIWLYRGKQGIHAKWFQYICYAFYPGHMIILYLIYWIMYRR